MSMKMKFTVYEMSLYITKLIYMHFIKNFISQTNQILKNYDICFLTKTINCAKNAFLFK